MRYSVDRIPYAVLSSLNFQATYPASRLADLLRPRRVARSVSTGATTVVLELGAAPVALFALSFENANFTTVDAYATNTNPATGGFVWTAQTHLAGAPYTLTVDIEDGRRKLRVALSGATFRWVYLVLSAPVAGATYYELGSVGAWSTLTTLAKNAGVPYDKMPLVASRALEYGSGAREVQSLGPSGLTISTSTVNIPRNGSAHAQYAALARTARDLILLWDENEGDASKMYHVQVAETWTISRSNPGAPLVDVTGIRLTQVI